ncbi:MAG: hypothetical protein HDR20_12415 [Lachnospiraceae bacterium]|nr:hypothetical protein [Lachnospiraceae bacterium]
MSNREILFRAKRKSDGEWIFGNLLRTDDDGICIIQNHVPHHLLKNYEVDSETICQYTGLTDKNGRKIFEGDIVQYSKIGAVGKVVWYEGDYIGFAVDDIDDSFQQYDKELFDKHEVIGNIFDNPELLEVENETD